MFIRLENIYSSELGKFWEMADDYSLTLILRIYTVIYFMCPIITIFMLTRANRTRCIFYEFIIEITNSRISCLPSF